MKNSKTKKILSILLAVMMVVGMIPATAIPAYAEDEATCPVDGATGTGTEADPIIVDTYEELKAAFALSSNQKVYYIQVLGDIEVEEPVLLTSNKVVTINGRLFGENNLIRLSGGENITIQGTGSLVSEKDSCIKLEEKSSLDIKGNLNIESKSTYAVLNKAKTINIEGGVFTGAKYSIHLDSALATVKMSGGYFPNGIFSDLSQFELKDGCFYSYEDGTLSTTLRERVPFEVVYVGYKFGLATQTPAMPEGKTETNLGSYTVGTKEAAITFEFAANPLPDSLKNNGWTIKEELQVFSAKRGLIKTQSNNQPYTIDKSIEDTYIIVEKVTFNDGLSDIKVIRHTFTVSIHPEGYVPDGECPVDGAIGMGTEDDPITVYTYETLKAAFALSSNQKVYYIQVLGDIEVEEPVLLTSNKVVTINGRLFGENNLIRLSGGENITIQGTGSLVSEKDSCIKLEEKSSLDIKGNLNIESKSTYAVLNKAKTINIEGGVFTGAKYSIHLDSALATVKMSGGYFPNGFFSSLSQFELKDGCFYSYEDGTLSTTLRERVPVEVCSLGFENQYPAMPEGETAKELGIRETGKNGILTVKFTPESLPQASIDAGYKVKEDLKIYDPTGKLIKSQASGASCPLVPEIEGEYRIVETLTLTDPDENEVLSLTNTFTFTAENMYSVFARISGVPEGRPITINLYKAGEDTPFKTTTAYGQGDFDIDNLPLDVAFEIEGVPKGDYILEAKCNNYVTYRYSFTIKDKSFTDLIFMESYKSVVVDISGMYSTDTASVKVYEKGTDTVLHTATIKGNGSHIFAEFAKGDYTVEVSATGYKTKTSNLYVYDSDNVKGVSFEMELDPTKVDFGFGTQTPSVTDYEKEKGITNMGLVFEAPSFSFTAAQLNYKYLDMGYSVTTDIQVWLSDSAVGGGDTNHSWACPSGSYGTKRVVEKVILLDPDGKEIATKSHTYTFTYLPLKFNTQKPSVTADEAAAGVTNLGTLTAAPTFSFSAVPIDSAALINEGYSIKVKTEAYQGDILVYSAENGDPYIHAYQYQGKVVQTIELYKNDELIGTKSHTYNFNMEFPEGTLTLGNDFLSIEEGSTQKITAVVMPEDLANVLRWSSSNENIVTVDNNGNVTALQAGSAIITASLPDGTKAYCPVLVTASDVLVYVGGVGLREGEYLAERSSVPTTATRPADNYAYLSTVDGKLTLTLNNYNYEGTGTFISNRLTYGIYSSADIKIVAYGDNNIGPITAPLERYTSYGIGEGETISINSDDYSTLTIKGVNTGIDLARYLFINGNLNMTDVAGGVSGGNTMGRVALESGKINIDCTGTAFNLIGGELAFDGAQVKLNCNSGIRFVRTGNLWINAGRLNIFAETSGIQIKSGDGFQMDNGIVLVDAEYNAIEAEDTLTINGGYMLLRSFNTASDSTYSAVNGSGTVTLGTGITGKGALTSAGSSSLTNYSESYKKHFDYLVFSESGINSFLKQPESGSVEKGETLTVSWELTFTPVRLVLRTNDGSTNTYTELDVKTTSLELPILPEGGYYLIQAYYATSSYKPSDKIYVTEVTTTLKGNISSYLSDSEFITLTLYDENMDIPYYQSVLPGNTASYSFPDVPYGEYVLVAEKSGHVPYQCTIVAEGDALYQNVELNLYADTNFNGEIDVQDYQALINAVLSDDHEQIETEEYDDLIHYDIDGDGYLDAIDAAFMALIVNGHKTIDEVYDLKKGDYDYDGEAYTESDLIAMYHVLSDIDSSAPTLSTSQKFASDLNYNGKVDEGDLAILTGRYGTIEETTCEENIKVYYRWGNSYTTCTATAMCTLCNKKVAVETVDSVLNADGSYTATFTNALLGTKTYKKQ